MDKPDHGPINRIELLLIPAIPEDKENGVEARPEGWAIQVQRYAPLFRADGSVAKGEVHRHAYDVGQPIPDDADPLIRKVAATVDRLDPAEVFADVSRAGITASTKDATRL
jgi:hypothetical protein